MGVIDNTLWVEKYRPQSLEELALSDETRALFAQYIEDGEIPHLLLTGPPGTGKTTVSLILSKAIDAKILTLNASNDRGIDVIREQVINFARGKMMSRWNIIFLDEADQLTPDAQNALRNIMETYASRARFILTGNRLHKITTPIRSRCVEIVIAQTTLKQRFEVLKRILEAEEVAIEPPVLLGYAERYTDLRQLIMRAQKSVQTNKGKLGPVADLDLSGKDYLEKILDKDYPALRYAASAAGFDGQQALRVLFHAIPDEHPQAARLRFTVAKAVHDSNYAPDPVITFLGTASELMTFV